MLWDHRINEELLHKTQVYGAVLTAFQALTDQGKSLHSCAGMHMCYH